MSEFGGSSLFDGGKIANTSKQAVSQVPLFKWLIKSNCVIYNPSFVARGWDWNPGPNS